MVRIGDNVVLATATANPDPREGIDFFPLTVDYREYTYAGGRIPGGFIKREGRPSEREILTSRQIDRPIRPLFPEGFRCETQVIAFVLSADTENDPDVAGINGASAALTISDIPFHGPIGAVRVGLVEWRIRRQPDLRRDARRPAEHHGRRHRRRHRDDRVRRQGSEGRDGRGRHRVRPHRDQEDLRRHQRSARKRPASRSAQVTPPEFDEAYFDDLKNEDRRRPDRPPRHREASQGRKLHADQGAQERTEGCDSGRRRSGAARSSRPTTRPCASTFSASRCIEQKRRPDGRAFDQIRDIWIEVGVLPRTHGSAIFTRGETQALVTTTLGTSDDMQRLEVFEGEAKKRFMLHYNFPPFSVGEVAFLRGAGRREIGHGALAERAISAVLPSEDDWPYAMRVVSDILESNGSSSMATVCGASLSLMDAGVPLKAPVAGVAMGLVKEGEDYAILTDIAGAEDHYGDMDFKVAGTHDGITALQMDIKVSGITAQIMREALAQAQRGRLYILDKMNEVISAPREKVSSYAPRIYTLQIPVDKIRDVIGPGGKMIRSIIEQTGVKIDVEDSGKVNVASNDEASAAKALQMIGDLTATAEVGKTYLGTVTRLADFGAFVEIIPGTDGLLHISEVAEHRIKDVRDELKEGDQVLVKVLAVEGNRIRLSRKAILKEQRAKMGGGELPPDNGGGDGGGEPAHAPALTIEGGADFADDEPNFNRDAPVAGGGADRGPERSGDRGPDRGGDRGRRPGGGGGGRGRGRGGPGRGGRGGFGGGGHGGGRH